VSGGVVLAGRSAPLACGVGMWLAWTRNDPTAGRGRMGGTANGRWLPLIGPHRSRRHRHTASVLLVRARSVASDPAQFVVQ
jgi:hypothetical protein